MRLDSSNLPPSFIAAHGKPVTLRHSPDCQCPKCSRAKAAPALPANEPTAKEPAKPAVKPIRERRRRVMNRAERAYSLILDARMQANEIVSWEFEGLTLRWGKAEAFAYTPDFTIVASIEHVRPITSKSFAYVQLVFIEIKGSHVWKDDATRFRHARDNFPLYDFQMWQKSKTGWEQIR